MLSTMRFSKGIVPRVPARALAADPAMWKFAHGAFDPETPMSVPLEGIDKPADTPVPNAGTVSISTLANGVRVASQDDGGIVSALGVYVESGSRHETPYTAGATHLLEHAAFKGSAARTKYRMTRDVERTGAGFSAAASRETLAYAAECMRDKAADVMSILAETAVSPMIALKDESSIDLDGATSEIEAHVTAIKGELKDYSAEPSGKVTESIHAAAFHGNTLGTFASITFCTYGSYSPILHIPEARGCADARISVCSALVAAS